MPAPRVHHLNCGTMCPVARSLMTGGPERLVCHCLLVETERSGLLLVDTGYGLEDVRDPRGRLGAAFLRVARPALAAHETAARQVEKLGFRREDVRHIVVTHLDLDHAGGLADFPWASIHVYGPELDAAKARATGLERRRYRPAQWAHGPRWSRHAVSGERWFGFEAVRALDESDPDVLLVPLIGHTRGHCGVAVRVGQGAGGGSRGGAGGRPGRGPEWLLHAGDAYFHRGSIVPDAGRVPIGLRIFEALANVDACARRENQTRLRELAADRCGIVRVFCAHDPGEFLSSG